MMMMMMMMIWNNVSSAWQQTSGKNDYGTVSMPKDSIQTRVVTVDTTKILLFR